MIVGVAGIVVCVGDGVGLGLGINVGMDVKVGAAVARMDTRGEVGVGPSVKSELRPMPPAIKHSTRRTTTRTTPAARTGRENIGD
jgi:hypothetical protein